MKKIGLILILLLASSCASIEKKRDLSKIDNDVDHEYIEVKEKSSLSNINISSVPVVKMSREIKSSLSPSNTSANVFNNREESNVNHSFHNFKSQSLNLIQNPINGNELIENVLLHPDFLNTIAKSSSMLLRASYKDYQYNDEFIINAGINYISHLDKNKIYFSKQDVDSFTKGGDNISLMKDSFEGNDLKWMFDVYSFYYQTRVDRFNYFTEKTKNDMWEEFFNHSKKSESWILKIDDWLDEDETIDRWHNAMYDDYITLIASGSSPKEAFEKIYNAHESGVSRLQDMNILEGFLNSYAKYFDPHSSYLSPLSKNEFQSRLKNFITGIGVVWEKRENDIYIKQIIANSPAHKDENIKVGYRLKKIGSSKDDKTPVSNMSITQIRELINNYPQIYLVLKDDKDAKFETLISKKEIKTNSNRATGKIINLSHDENKKYNALVISVPVFYKTQTQNSSDSISKDIKNIILTHSSNPPNLILLDLRGNGGGVMSEAVSVISLFLQDKKVLGVKSSDSWAVYQSLPSDIVWSGPLAVLVDNRSASASEIVAGALQDYNRAIILGSDTYGKGTAQMLFDFDNWANLPASVFGQLNLTSMMFFKPSGQSTQLNGINPDVYIGLKPDYELTHGERSYSNSIPPDSTSPLYESTPSIQGPIPWQFKKDDLQEFADNRWKNKSWFSLLNKIQEHAKLNEKDERHLSLELRKTHRQYQIEKHNELKQIMSSTNEVVKDDIVLSEALMVAKKAFDGVNYQYYITYNKKDK